ncbi:MAG: nucleotide exchange factor GrpE [Armatimonadota bacterium]
MMTSAIVITLVVTWYTLTAARPSLGAGIPLPRDLVSSPSHLQVTVTGTTTNTWPWGQQAVLWLIALGLIGYGVAGIIRWWQCRPVNESPSTEQVTADEQSTAETVETPSLPEEAPVPNSPGTLLARLIELSQEFDGTTYELQRLNANREVQLQNWQRTCTDILRRMLPVLENLEPFLHDEEGRVVELATLIHGRLLTELATVGVTQINPTPGDAYDAAYQQIDAASTGYPPYTITEVIAAGYLFAPRAAEQHGIVLKPATVVVTGAPDEVTALPLEAETAEHEVVAEALETGSLVDEKFDLPSTFPAPDETEQPPPNGVYGGDPSERYMDDVELYRFTEDSIEETENSIKVYTLEEEGHAGKETDIFAHLQNEKREKSRETPEGNG